METRMVLLALAAISFLVLGCVQPPLPPDQPPEPPANGYVGNGMGSPSPADGLIGGNTNSQVPNDIPPLPG